VVTRTSGINGTGCKYHSLAFLKVSNIADIVNALDFRQQRYYEIYFAFPDIAPNANWRGVMIKLE
jgi:hypothetical protein